MVPYRAPDPGLALLAFVLLTVAAALVLWPERGVAARVQRSRRLSRRVMTEDALKHVANREIAGRPPTVSSVAGALGLREAPARQLLDQMQTGGLVVVDVDSLRLTNDGRDAALRVIRAHRLWERYLSEETGYAESDWHGLADVREHAIDDVLANDLAAALGHPTHDPHGDPIPDEFGDLRPDSASSLGMVAQGTTVRVTHVEDEPEAVYAQLLAAGLYAGQVLHVLETTPLRVRFWTGDQEHVLAPILAEYVTVLEVGGNGSGEVAALEAETHPLSSLAPGEGARVVSLSPRCRGVQRRRLMDLGLLPGALVTAELVSASGNPTAYRIRGALIALRADQAYLIRVTAPTEGAA